MNTGDDQISDLHQGNEAVLRFFMDQYSRSLHFFAFKYTKDEQVAAEIISDAFVKLWECRKKILSTDHIKSFLFLVVRNSSLDHLKSKRNHYLNDEALMMELGTGDQDILTKIIYSELIELIMVEIDKLPKQQAAIFRLSVIDGKETKEICEELNTTPGTVYFARSKALSTLKEIFASKKISFYQITLALFLHSVT